MIELLNEFYNAHPILSDIIGIVFVFTVYLIVYIRNNENWNS